MTEQTSRSAAIQWFSFPKPSAVQFAIAIPLMAGPVMDSPQVKAMCACRSFQFLMVSLHHLFAGYARIIACAPKRG
jgi:hypothetical protein